MIKAQENVGKLKPYSYPVSFYEKIKEYNLDLDRTLKLNYNEPTFLPSPKVRRMLSKFIKSGNLNFYPEWKCDELKQKISEYANTKSSQIIIGNGSDELLLVIAMTYLNKGDKVIIPTPNYSMFYVDTEIMGAKVVEVLCENDLRFDTKKIIQAINQKTKIIYLSNPQAIIGGLFSREDIKSILEAAKKAIVIVDEAYIEYCDGSVVDLIKSYDNLIVTRTFSKAFSIASMRLGYCISSEYNIDELNKVKELLPESVNKFAQIAGFYALSDLGYMKEKKLSVIKAREYMAQKLRELGLKVYDSQANYILVNLENNDKANKIYLELEKKGVFVREVYSKPKLVGCLRIGMPLYEEASLLLEKITQAIIKMELSEVDTLLFDMDGVLVDVSNSYMLAIKKTAELFLKKEISFEDIQAYKEKGGLNNDWDTVQAILKDNDTDIDRQIIISEFDKIYLGGAIDNEKLIVKRNLLDNLSKKYKLGIVTGRPKRDADYTIDKFGLRKYFPAIITLDDVKLGKPDKEGILRAIKLLGAKKTVYFGDTVDDILAGKNAGIPSVGILPPQYFANTSRILKEKGASIILDNINKLDEAI